MVDQTSPHKVRLTEKLKSHVQEVSAVSIKPPQFFRSNPEIWFRQLESQFHLSKITGTTTKFHHALTLLPEDIACDVITDDVVKYEDLKEALIRHLKANSHELIERALSAMELGDKRPSQLVTKNSRYGREDPIFKQTFHSI